LRVSHRQPPGEDPLKPEQLERENERLSRENEKLRQELIERDKKIAELGRKLSLRLQNSTTSSKPPSSDGLAGEQRPRGSRRKKGCHKPGGPPGHRGHWRGLAPLSRVDQVIGLFPPKCRHCDSRLSRRMSAQGEPRRHQVTELPPIEAHITEY
jgi:transposase